MTFSQRTPLFRCGATVRFAGLIAALLIVSVGLQGPVTAQGVAIPNFWDPRARLERPDPASLRQLRFLTDDEFPPLHFAGPDGAPTGFTVELARAACEVLGINCTVQVRRFDTLLDSLAEARGDIVAAAIPIDAELRRRFAVTHTYLRTPARFAARKDRDQPEPSPQMLDGKTVGVVSGTAHEAFLKAFFPQAKLQPVDSLTVAEAALRRGDVDLAFGDGLGLALWIGGTDAGDCCALIGGPYLESRYFGEGIGFVLRKEDEPLRRAFDYALQRLWDEGKYAELYLRFFPVSPF